MKHFLLLALIVFSSLSFSNGKKTSRRPIAENNLKINQIQIIASHNSYHKRTDAAVLRFLNAMHSLGVLPGDLNPQEIDYNNASLTEQLEKYGVRGLELDVWNDPQGGRFYYRKGKAFAFKPIASKIEALKQPGFKLIHIPDFDFNSTNLTFKEALAEIKKWSDEHPEHLPLFINVETETDAPGDIVHFLHNLTRAAPFDSAAADNLDFEIKSVFGDNLDEVITPDRVRGNYPTLEAAVLAGNWPSLASAKGKLMFIMDHDGNSGDAYKAGHPSLKGRAMFMYAEPGTPEAAFVIHNESIGEFKQIQECVKKGYIVRTRSDAGTHQAREGDYSTMNAALGSWAQIISTDYYRPDPRSVKHPRKWSNYQVQMPGGGMARVDSISVPRNVQVESIHE